MTLDTIWLAREGGIAFFPGLSKSTPVDLSAWSAHDKAALQALLARMHNKPSKNKIADKQIYRCSLHPDSSDVLYIDPDQLNEQDDLLFQKLIEDWHNTLQTRR
jgi:hypothetical protein